MKLTNASHSLYNTVIPLTLLYIIQKVVSYEAGVQFGQQQSVEDKNIPKEQLQEKINLEKSKDQKLIVRLPSNSLLKYTSYKDVSILHFRVPPDTRNSYFTFKAFEESKSAFQRHCKPKDVTVHLKANSFPVISPENITFPKNFLSSDQRFKIYDLQFLSDEQQHRINIQGPEIGSWFAVAFVSWTDPNNERIEQQGLSASCDTVLRAELTVSRVYPIIMNDGKVDNANLSGCPVPPSIGKRVNVEQSADTTRKMIYQREQAGLHNASPIPNSTQAHFRPGGSAGRNKADNESNSTTNNEVIYKFFAPDDVTEATARISFAEVCAHCPNVSFHVKANAFPASCSEEEQSWDGNEHNYFHGTVISPNQTEEISIEFYVQPSTWHYVRLRFAEANDEFCLGLRPSKLTGDEVAVAMAGTGADPSFETYNVSFALQIEFNQQAEEAENESVVAQSHSSSQTQTASLSEPAAISSWQPVRFRGMDFYSLLRQSYHEFFMFDYDLYPDANGTVPVLLNLTAHSAAGFAFELGEVYDIGGTLTFAMSMKQEMRFNSELKPPPPTTAPASERGGILAEKLVGGMDDASAATGHEKMSRSNQSMQIIVCMHLGEPGAPTWPDKCRYGQRLLPASIIVNNTDLMGQVHVPFPESGLWYVTMGLYCHGAGTARVTIIDSVKEFVRQHVLMLSQMRAPCACAANKNWYEMCIGSRECLANMNETETLRVKECMMDFKCTPDYEQMTRQFEIHYKSATEQHFALDNCNTSVIFSVSSSPCVSGRCGRFGRCYHYMSGGFVFSTCVCMKGYRGWDCTEDSQVPSSISILMASLLLTLSNLLFIPSVYMAFRRYYYTECIIYFFAMFFSIFYHACDSGEDEYSFCLVKIGVLQFCDFYCGLLAIWVTLVAMAHIPQKFVSLLHMFGAILLAFGTELNKQSLWVFLAPALTGICLISTSWGMRCRNTRQCFPARRYLTIFMPFGMVLVMVGLVCYAFLQTKQNYHIVHSIWHMVMALSIMCLLPSPKSFVPKC